MYRQSYFISALLVLCFLGGNISAQLQPPLSPSLDSIPTTRSVLRVNILGIGLGGEFPITPTWTFYLEAGAGIQVAQIPQVSGTPRQKIFTVPYGTLQTRYYYNLNRRKKKGKRIDLFSANYIGLALPYLASTSLSERLYGIGPVWGFMRNFGKRGYVGFHIGPGFYFDAGEQVQRTRLYPFNLNTWAGTGFTF
ncbi:MAG: hypothetical protein AAGI38_19085 [Bacteroidota bacterium]